MSQSAFGKSAFGSSLPSLGFEKPKYRPRRERRKQGHHYGALGLAGNLLSDVKDAVVGIPFGVANIVGSTGHDVLGAALHHDYDFNRSRDVGGKVLSGTWQTWSPLFHGHPIAFAQQTYAHPLAPLLDVATVFTLGAGGVAKGGQVLADAGKISKTGRLARAGQATKDTIKAEGAPEAYRHYDKNPFVRGRQRATVSVQHELADHLPKWFGEGGKVRNLTDEGFHSRYMKRHESYRGGATKAAIQAEMAAYVKSGHDVVHDPHGVAVRIDAHGGEQLRAHAFKLSEKELLAGNSKGKGYLKDGFTFVRDTPGKTPLVTSAEEFESKALGSFVNRHTTDRLNKAARDKDGKYLVVMKHDAQTWVKEGINSSKFVKRLYKHPTTVWKYLVLATRPGYFVNNAVGNSMMYMVEFGGLGAMRGLADAYRQVHGERKAWKDLEGADRQMRKLHGDWQDEFYLGVHQGFAQDVMQQLKLKGKKHPKAAKFVNVAGQGLYPITHKVADVFLRRASVNALLRKNPEVQALMRQGHSFDHAARQASTNPAIRDRIQEQVNDALGDYHHLNSLEQGIRQVIPFYTWDRAIMRHGVKLALNKPAKAAALTAVAQSGTDAAHETLGNVPEFLKGAIPLGHAGGRQRILTTKGLNPYASIGDVLEAGVQLVGGDPKKAGATLGSQINPIPAGAMEYITGQDLLSGARVTPGPGGLAGNIFKGLTVDTPAGNLIKRMLSGEQHPRQNARTGEVKPFLFKKDRKEQGLAFLGVTVKEMNEERAGDLYRKEHGIKKGRRRRRKEPMLPKTFGNQSSAF